MATPDFILKLREKIGHDPLWLMGCTAVVERDGEVLLVKRADSGAWTAITGIVDPGEEPARAAAREALEEANVVIEPVRLAAISVTPPVTYANGDQTQYLDFNFRCRYVSGDPYPADGENTEVAWFPLDSPPPMSESQAARLAAGLADGERTAFVF